MSAIGTVERNLTVSEIALMARVSEATIYRWKREGLLSAIRARPGGRLLFAAADVERLLSAEGAAPANETTPI